MEAIVGFLLRQPYSVDINAKDCCNRTAYHFACCLTSETGQKIRDRLIISYADIEAKDARGRTGEDYSKMSNKSDLIEKERKAVYGLAVELVCVDKYEDMRKLIRSKKKGLKEFQAIIRQYKFPVTGLHKVLGPLMPKYRDLIFLAIDYGKVDIVYKLVNLGADLCRREKYEKEKEDGTVEKKYYTPAQRAAHLGMDELANFLLQKQQSQIEKRKNQTTLLPKRAIEAHLTLSSRSRSMPSVFVTQLSVPVM